MPRPRNVTPTYSLHRQSGRGRLTWTDTAGVRHEKLLPGPFGSPESLTAKARLELEIATSPTQAVVNTNDITVAEVLAPGRGPAGTGRADRPDVFAAYNRTVTLDEVVAWHEQLGGHAVAERTGEWVEFRREGKEDGTSFNVEVRNGVPVTFNFSTHAGLPERVGLSPSRVRCFYEKGSCDTRTIRAFADQLRKELGWPEVAAGAGSWVPPGDGPRTPDQPPPQHVRRHRRGERPPVRRRPRRGRAVRGRLGSLGGVRRHPVGAGQERGAGRAAGEGDDRPHGP